MGKNKYTEKEALDSLLRNPGIFLRGRTLMVARNSVGNGSLGRIDFLVHKHGYSMQWTKERKAKEES